MKKRTFIKNLLFSILTVLIFFVSIELLSQIIYFSFYAKSETERIEKLKTEYYLHDPLLGWITRSDFTILKESGSKNRKCYYRINSESCRDYDFNLRKPRNTIRILCLGDSITEGPGVDNHQTYPKLLEAKLNLNSSQTKYEVFNCGVGDYGIKQEYLFLSKRLIKYNPDVVIVGYFLNDARGFVPAKALYLTNPVQKLLDKSRLVYFINKIILKYSIKAQYKKWEKYRFNWEPGYKQGKWLNNKEEAHRIIALAKNDWGIAWQKSGIKRTEHYLNKFISLSKEYNFKFIFLILPVGMQVYANFDDEYLNLPQVRLGSFCRTNDITFIDLLPYLKQHRSREIFMDQCHYTLEGLDLVVNKVYKVIKNNGY